MSGNKVLVIGCFALSVLVVPAIALAVKPFRVNMTGADASLQASSATNSSLSDDSFLSISVGQVTDKKTRLSQTSLDFLFTRSSDSTVITFSGNISNASVVVSGNGEQLSIFITPASLGGICFSLGSVCSDTFSLVSFVSLSFTRNHAYKFTQESSVKGVLPDGTHIDDKFHETFRGADVNGVVFGAAFFSDAGEISQLHGDPALK